MAVTIHQRAALCVNDHTAFPLEYVEKVAAAGYARIDILLNPNHPDLTPVVPPRYVAGVQGLGMKCWGRVWADDFKSPEAMHAFLVSERLRLRQQDEQGIAWTMGGFGVNAEDGWEAKDQETGGNYSVRFLNLFRSDPVTAKL